MIAVRLDRPGPVRLLRECHETAVTLWQIERYARPIFGSSFGKAFNGQIGRRRAVDFLRAAFSPDGCIETGTYLGWTTTHLASYGLPIYTAEVKPGHYHLAKQVVRRFSNVTLVCGDSADAIRWVARRASVERPLVYLDAHWERRLPLHDELEAAFDSWRDVVVVIDDFRVPHDPGYHFDVYGGEALSLERIDVPAHAAIAFPSLPAHQETGFRRGAVFLGGGANAIAALRRAAAEGLLSIHRDGAS